MTSAYWDFTEVSVIALSRFCSSLSDWFTRCCRFKKTALQKSRPQIACSKRSDSGERCEVKKAMKSRGGLGRDSFLLLQRSPLSERLEQARPQTTLKVR